MFSEFELFIVCELDLDLLCFALLCFVRVRILMPCLVERKQNNPCINLATFLRDISQSLILMGHLPLLVIHFLKRDINIKSNFEHCVVVTNAIIGL